MNEEEEITLNTPALGAGDISELLTTRTSYEVPQIDGDFVEMCSRAQKGDQTAIAALWPVIYTKVYDSIKDVVKDAEALQELASEGVDRYLLGWVNPPNPRGTGKPGPVPPMIQECQHNFLKHIDGWVKLYMLRVREEVNYDPFAVGAVESVHSEDEDGHEDFLASHEIGVGDMRDEYVPTPEDVMVAKDTLDKFREWLPPHLQDIFDGARMGMKQEAIAFSIGITQGEVSRRLAEMYDLMPRFKRQCL